MSTFDRFDICDVYYLLESDFNVSGVLQARKSNQRRKMSSGFQLHRMGFKPSPMLSYDVLSDNGKELYHEKCLEYGFTEQLRDIDSIEAIQALPQAILYQTDYDVLHILVMIGLIDSEDGDGTTEPETWNRFWAQDYQGCFVLLDSSGADYLAVWGFFGSVPYLSKALDLLWLNGKLLTEES